LVGQIPSICITLNFFSVHLRLNSSVLNHDNLQWHIESKNSLQNYLPYIGLYKYVCYIFWISTLMIKRNNIYIHLSIANLWFIISWCRQNGDQLCIIIKHYFSLSLFFSGTISFFRFIIYYTMNIINLYNTMSLSKDEFFCIKILNNPL
jgi:hypothetical protein